MKKKVLNSLITLSIASAFAFPTLASAEIEKLPEPMVGQTSSTQYVGHGNSQEEITFYGSVTGNEAVYNYGQPGKETPDGKDQSGRELFGFDQQKLMKCVNSLILLGNGSYCFNKNLATNAVDMMVSRTYRDSFPSEEVAALFYPPEGVIIGDSYLGGRSLSNFNYWGRHLSSTKGSADSDETYWGLGGYILNSDAQSTLDPNSKVYQSYKNKIDIMKGEGRSICSTVPMKAYRIYLQPPAGVVVPFIYPPYINDPSLSPEGVIFRTDPNFGAGCGSLFLSGPKQYAGLGTFIVDGDLSIGDATAGAYLNLSPESSEDRLGFIVLGNVTIAANSKVQASIFATGNISFTGSNIEMTGSFVAQRFNGVGQGSGNKNIKIYYDNRLESKMPPGFGFLNMPHPGQ